MDIEEEIARALDEAFDAWSGDESEPQFVARRIMPLVNRVRAEALREAADEIEMKRNEPGLVKLDVQYAGYYTGIRSGMEWAVRAIRSRIEQNSEGESK